MSDQPQGQVFCSNCKGGNPPGAELCQWCKAPLGAQQSPQYQPQYQQQQPYPQQPYPQQPSTTTVIVQQQKGPPWLLIILGVLGLCALSCVGFFVISGLLVRSGVEALGTAIPVSLTREAATAEAFVNLPADSASLIGTAQETAGLRFTINEVRRTTEGQFGNADAGKEFLIVNLTIENTDNTEHTFSSFIGVDVRDDTGQKYNASLSADTKASPDGTIQPGGKNTGELAFEVPIDATGLVFIYDPLFGGDPIRWKLDK